MRSSPAREASTKTGRTIQAIYARRHALGVRMGERSKRGGRMGGLTHETRWIMEHRSK